MDLGAFVEWLHGEIRSALERDPHCKSYEGEIDVEVNGALDRPGVKLTLRLYLFAPNGREHTWTGATVAEVCGLAHDDITRWIAEEREA